jgi:hypothetical protein
MSDKLGKELGMDRVITNIDNFAGSYSANDLCDFLCDGGWNYEVG